MYVWLITPARHMWFQEPNVGWSEMASREKRALAPSKTKQKANNDSSSLAAAIADSSNKSASALSSSSRKSSSSSSKSQIARDILEAVATSSPLPAKIDASLPRKRALQTALKRKQKAKKTLIKVKQKVPLKTLKRLAEAKKALSKNKKRKPVQKLAQHQHNASENSLDTSAESDDTKSEPPLTLILSPFGLFFFFTISFWFPPRTWFLQLILCLLDYFSSYLSSLT